MGLFRKKAKKEVQLPDFSDVTSYEKAIALVQEGKLEKIYIIPLEYEGGEHLENRTFTTPRIAKLKARDELIIHDMVYMGGADTYSCEPVYRGDSVVPCSFRIEAIRNGHVSFSEELKVW